MKKILLSIGIAAYNEEKNIENLLRQVLKQHKYNYKLEAVYVACDGCTDNTLEIVKRLAKKHPIIKVIHDGKRVGKIYRLNQIYKLTRSDIHVTLDADLILYNERTVDALVSGFSSSKVGLVGGSTMHLPSQTNFEKILNVWSDFWYMTKKSINRGDSVHNHPGCISAMRRELYKKTKIPMEVYSDDDFLYFNAKILGYKFKYVDEAKVYFRNVNNFSDFVNQHTRFLTLKDEIAKYFGKNIYRYYSVPLKNKIKGLLVVLKSDPLYLMLAIGLQIYLRLLIIFKKEDYLGGVWRLANSSKILGETI